MASSLGGKARQQLFIEVVSQAERGRPDSFGSEPRCRRRERVELAFAPRVARYIRGREWHTSLRLEDCSDGSVRLTVKVCRDWALRSWILRFGPHARVVAPSALAEEIFEQLEKARDGNAPRLAVEMPRMYPPLQPRLPMR